MLDHIINSQNQDNSTTGSGFKTVPPPFNGNYTPMPEEDEVTTYVSTTFVSADSISEEGSTKNSLVGNGVDWVIVEDEELSEELLVTKNANNHRDNCILVEIDVPVVVKPNVSTVVTKPKIPKTFKKIQFVKAGTMNQEVQKIEHISNTEFIQNKVFDEAEIYERESKDSIFKKKFVKKPQQFGSRGFVEKVPENNKESKHVWKLKGSE
ncbi:hypothetical protein L1987_57828 [Smallanthus sonchifolius]|uniref:Uncharacterized protein n=1 Tax=Smallanthus sonchifolius TaxID=185202 RepID=A0ACB9DDW2_9ASTR|nr:hypothetical protein L1987_57828 [Smallanthus sonchifolius]